MTLFLGLSIVVLGVLVWGISLYRLWEQEQSREAPLSETTKKVALYYEKIARYTRRVWYVLLRGVKILREKSTRGITRAFFFLFPNAKHAFSEKDELTGLTDGPSSYLLMSVSEYKKEVKVNRKRKHIKQDAA